MNIKRIGFLALLLAFAGMAMLSPNMAQAASFDQSLSIGSSGFGVVALQNFLIEKGFLNITAPTGYFGPMTKAAVASFQLNQGISATGFFGPLSRAAANSNSQVATAMPKSTVALVSVTPTNSNVASVIAANSKDISWKTSEYPASTGVNINLIRKVKDNPNTYEFVRSIAANTPNDGAATWSPSSNEKTSDLFIEVTCATAVDFTDGCRVDGAPGKAL